MIKFTKTDPFWFQVRVGDNVVGGLSQYTNGAWQVKDADARGISPKFANLKDAKAFARKHFS